MLVMLAKVYRKPEVIRYNFIYALFAVPWFSVAAETPFLQLSSHDLPAGHVLS